MEAENVTMQLLTGGAQVLPQKYITNDFAHMKGADMDQFVVSELPNVDIKQFKKLPIGRKRSLLVMVFVEGKSYDEAFDATAATGVMEAPKSGEVLEPDMLSSTAHELENLTPEKAEAMAMEILDTQEFSAFKLGGVFSVMMVNGWTGGYDNFKDYCETKFGISYRKAAYWANIYTGLVDSGIPWDQVKGIGWTKLITLLPVLSKDNVDQWVADAEKVSNIQLQELVKKQKAIADGTDQGGEVAPVTTLTFKVHGDQKATIRAAVEKAKEISGTSVDTVALEYIALEYLGNAQPAGAVKGEEASDAGMVDTLRAKGWKVALDLLEQAFPTLEMSVSIPEED